MKCKNCNNEVDKNQLSEYANGDFCSKKCARSYSTKNDNKSETKIAKCVNCGEEIEINKRASIKTCECDECKKIKKINKKLLLKTNRDVVEYKGSVKCQYGCDQYAKYILKNGKYCCSKKYQSCINIRKKSSDSLKKLYKEGKLIGWNIPDEKRAWSKGKTFGNIDEIFKKNSTYGGGSVRNILIKKKLKKYECDNCGISKWLDKDIILELHHINGINRDHRLENLMFLCPNCHSQTETFKNYNNKKETVPDEILIKNLKKCRSIRSALLSSNLSGKGGNYNRAYNLINKYDIEVGVDYNPSKTKKKYIL